jgi:hypothetical protein
MEELITALREQRVILFVGAGVSQNLGLPSFAKLINHLAEDLDYDAEIFRLFGDYLSLAEYHKIQKGPIGPLRGWMDREWHKDTDISSSHIHELIVNLKCPIIYTTNYDRWLELAHEHYGISYKKIVNEGSIPNINSGEVQIVKLHGDFDDDNSIVLTESSYFDRLSFDAPLDVKLRADALGKTMLFIGYSLGDINIRYLIYKMNVQWAKSKWVRVRPRWYFFLSSPNPIQEAILESRGITTIVSQNDDPGEGLKEFLEGLIKSTFSKT